MGRPVIWKEAGAGLNSRKQNVFNQMEHKVVSLDSCSGKQAVAFTKSLFNMLSTPILEQIKSSHMQLEAKMDAQNSRLKAEMSHSRWFIGIVSAVLGGVLATVVALVAG